MDVDMRHVNALVLVDDLDLLVLVLCANSLVELLDYRNELRDNFLKILERPFFERFRKFRVVRVCSCLRYDIDRLVH